MYDFYDAPISNDTQKRLRHNLKALYESIPETEGCLENIAKEDGCGSKCCEYQNPSVFYIEFLNTWNTVKTTWSKKQIISLIVKSIRNYLNTNLSKGCVFWEKETKKCLQHKTRPYNCRTYCQVPDEEFKPRYERLKVLYDSSPGSVLLDQCKLAKTVGIPPTAEEMTNWFAELQLLERDIGVAPADIHDGDGGSYRTYHDHILLKIGSQAFLNKLIQIRSLGESKEKDRFVDLLEEQLIAGVIKI